MKGENMKQCKKCGGTMGLLVNLSEVYVDENAVIYMCKKCFEIEVIRNRSE
jgi:predicted RNA-binding Zn-ribbon protein involved in translation (DUF1610 family)